VMLEAVVAVDKNGVIGSTKTNDLLWHLPADMNRFKALTTPHTVIMGRKTWDSIPNKFRPLANRRNIVLTRNKNFRAFGAEVFHDRGSIISAISKDEMAFVIGGQSVYELFMPFCNKLHITRVENEFSGDVKFPNKSQYGKWELIEAEWFMKDSKNPYHQTLMVYERVK
jgi:dihydrofolate reductase